MSANHQNRTLTVNGAVRESDNNSSLFGRLRSGTEQEHREIETLIDPIKNFCSLDTYKAHLLKTWRFYCPLEVALANLDWTSTGIDLSLRRKTLLLEQDMHILSVHREAVENGRRSLDLANLNFALGCLYVLEGATLGGQVISRHLAKLGIGPENGGMFFNGYGAKTGEMWKSFQTSASHYCVTEDQIGEAVNGAKWTFRTFRESMLTGQELNPHVA